MKSLLCLFAPDRSKQQKAAYRGLRNPEKVPDSKELSKAVLQAALPALFPDASIYPGAFWRSFQKAGILKQAYAGSISANIG